MLLRMFMVLIVWYFGCGLEVGTQAAAEKSAPALRVVQRALRQCPNAANHFQAGLRKFPDAILTIRRLHTARERLVTTSAAEMRVKRAALESGFFDRSRFAGDFRKLFGPLPSQTPRA
ncbi:helix-turn-helix domain-containing protein [Bythopirellula polymerisocia]|uniref:helix-turn-helix domain-containing protein n=1 Tax=Bythopirellula polymerisocia TaxID=2528003 RepID=UPI0011B527D5